VATKYFANKPIKKGFKHYRPGEEITGFTSWWRYWQLLRYNYVNKVDTVAAPVLAAVVPTNGTLSTEVTLPSDNGDPYTAYEYQVDAGAWVNVAFDQMDGASVFTLAVSSLTNGVSYSLKLRVINAAGTSPSSNTVSGTPRTTPSAPTALVATPGDGQLSIAFTAGSNGGSAITNYEYRIAPSTTFIAFSPVDTATPVVVTGMANDVAATVFIRAINAAGNGASASVTGTPTA
jgi:titin